MTPREPNPFDRPKPPLTEAERTELREALAKMTAAPWRPNIQWLHGDAAGIGPWSRAGYACVEDGTSADCSQAWHDANGITMLRNLADRLLAESDENAALRAALGKINDVRNSIIGLQQVNWSEHVYPLVAALNEVGLEGMDYPAAQERFLTTLQRIADLEASLAAARAETERCVNVVMSFRGQMVSSDLLADIRSCGTVTGGQ